LAKAIHVDFNKIGLAIEMAIPDMFDDFRASDEFRGVEQEEFE
jgi:hypothetical protein